jgi:uncharacterized membrane protein YccF (DUF307 family)
LPLTIVGIPFAWAHLKLAGLALWPIGKVIVPAQADRAWSPALALSQPRRYPIGEPTWHK